MSLSVFSSAVNLFNFQVDVAGKIDFDVAGGSISYDVDPGYSIVAEFPLPVSFGGFSLGIGTEYQLAREADNLPGDFSFWSKYLIIQKNLFSNSFNTLTPMVKLGTADVDTSSDFPAALDDAGFFYSLGARYRLSSLAYAELSWTVNESEYTNAGSTYDAQYTRVNFVWGTVFDSILKYK